MNRTTSGDAKGKAERQRDDSAADSGASHQPAGGIAGTPAGRGLCCHAGYHLQDIRELCLVKAATSDGYRYVSSHNESLNPKMQGRFETIFHESVLGVDYAGHVVLVKCYSGMANAACEVFDALKWKNVVGTLSGDDTFLIVARSERDAKTICNELTHHIGQH